jgi:hypothetical protein
VIDNLHDEDFKRVKDWEGMDLFEVLTHEERAPFLESVHSAIVARKEKEEDIERKYKLTMVSRILFIDSVCS